DAACVSSVHLQVEAVDVHPAGCGAEAVERRPDEPEAGERRRLGPVGGVDAEGALQAAVAEDEHEEVVPGLRVRTDDDDDATAEQLRELDLPERRRAHDPPAALGAAAGDFGDSRLGGPGSEDDELLPVAEVPPRAALGSLPPPRHEAGAPPPRH